MVKKKIHFSLLRNFCEFHFDPKLIEGLTTQNIKKLIITLRKRVRVE